MTDIVYRSATNYQLSIAVDYTAQLLELLMGTKFFLPYARFAFVSALMIQLFAARRSKMMTN